MKAVRGQRKINFDLLVIARGRGHVILCAGYLFLHKSYIVLVMAEIIDINEKLNAHPKAIKADAVAAEVERLLAEQQIAIIYRDHILTMRTRKYELKAATKPAVVEVLHTLLGIELKIGKRRLLCPDLATARYLSVFARLGVEAVAVPYDITQNFAAGGSTGISVVSHADLGRTSHQWSKCAIAIAGAFLSDFKSVYRNR